MVKSEIGKRNVGKFETFSYLGYNADATRILEL